jgi:hypothetical protein
MPKVNGEFIRGNVVWKEIFSVKKLIAARYVSLVVVSYTNDLAVSILAI